MKWFKCSNTIALNPKLGIVANLSKTYTHEVLATWIYLLAEASRKNEKGYLGNIDFDSIDYALDLLSGKSEKIYMALTAKGLITPENFISGWVEYQSDPTAAERQRKSRANRNSMSQHVTVTNSDVTQCHGVTAEERRGEEILDTDVSNNKKTKAKKDLGYSLEFEEFWKEYPPNDGSKKKAFESWTKIIKQGIENDSVITRAARDFKQYAERNGTERKFIPHAATWLNQSRWETDYTAGNTGFNGAAHNQKTGVTSRKAILDDQYAKAIAKIHRNAEAQELTRISSESDANSLPMLSDDGNLQ